MIGPFDHLLVLLIAVAWPLHSWKTYPSFVADVESGRPGARARGYIETGVIEWTLLLGCAILWIASDRSFSALGLVWPEGWHGSIATGVTVVVCAIALWQVWRFRNPSEAQLTQALDQMKHLKALLPHTTNERGLSMALAFTAGICEELLFRSFLIWYFAAFLPLPAAVLVSTVVFGLGHAYQGPAGAVRCGVLGLLAALLYVWSGTILLPIVLHVVVDVQALLIAFIANQHAPRNGPGSPALESA